MRISAGAGLQSAHGQSNRGGRLGPRKNRSGTEAGKGPAQPSHNSTGRTFTEGHCKEECRSPSSRWQQEKAGRSHPGRQKVVVGPDEEAMGGEKEKRFR